MDGININTYNTAQTETKDNPKNIHEIFNAEDFQKEVMDRIKGYNDDLLDLSPEFQYEYKKKGLDFNPQYELMRIAAAETVPSLKRVIASLENRIALLKNTKEGEALIPKIKRIIKKGRQKVGKLGIEEHIRIAAERAHKRREYMEESHHRARLSMKKIHRKKQECDDIKNADKIADGYGETVPQLSTIASDYIEAQTASAEVAVTSSAETAAVTDTSAEIIDISV